MNVDMRDFLPGQRSVMNTYGEIGCLEMLSEKMLDACDAFHEVIALVLTQFSEPLGGSKRNHERMAFPPRKNVKESVPSLPA